MEHTHGQAHAGYSGKAFRTGIAINMVFIALEVFYGLLSNSMALVSDAGHNFSDVAALAFSWLAIRLSERKPTIKFTYGFRRSTILAAVLNTMLLFAAAAFLLVETIGRLSAPAAINSGNVVVVATAGILVNGFTAWLFTRGRKHDLNIRSAFVHFLADTLVSAGVVLAGIIMYFTGITWIDAVVSFAIIVVILYSSFRLLIDSVSLALDAVPEFVDIGAVREYLSSLPEVTGIHDLHIWALSTNAAALTVHLETKVTAGNLSMPDIQRNLHDLFNIEHSTIQVEPGGMPEQCNHCN